MTKELSAALDAVEMTYEQVEEIANNILLNLLTPVNQIAATIKSQIENLSIDSIRYYMLQLQLETFQLSELRDKAAVKAQCAEALKKEAYAKSYLIQEGTQSQKDSSATISISENIVAECLYELVAALVKTKVDHSLRLIDTLKSILMSRMQEAKINNTLCAE